MMVRTKCWDCMFGSGPGCPVTMTYRYENSECIATDEQLASAAAQIAALQRERELERLPEQQKAMGRKHAAEAFGGEVEAE
jgi:hypothetical protein